MKSKKTVHDADKVGNNFVRAVEVRTKDLGILEMYSKEFILGYVAGFLKTHADEKLLDEMVSRVNQIQKEAA